MPQLNGKKYSYTKEGIAKYKKDKKRKKLFDKAEKLVGGKRFSDYPSLKKKKKKYTLSEAKQKLKKMGRRGDTELEHVNKDEQRILKAMGASRTKNPRTGLTENSWFSETIKRNTPSSTPKPKVTVPSIKVNVPKSTGDIVKGIQKSYDTSVKAHLPKGLDYQNVGKKMLETANATEEFVGGAVTNLYRAGVGTAAQILTGTNPFTQSNSNDESTTTSSTAKTASLSGGFGAMKKKKKKKGLLAEGEESGSNTRYGGKMSKRGLRTPKRTGLNIVKKNSSSTSLGM